MATNDHALAKKFQSISQADVPKGRDGKHKQIVEHLLDSIATLRDGSALKVPLADLPDTKENIRSALNRATRQRNIDIATSSDESFLYIWKSLTVRSDDSSGRRNSTSQQSTGRSEAFGLIRVQILRNRAQSFYAPQQSQAGHSGGDQQQAYRLRDSSTYGRWWRNDGQSWRGVQCRRDKGG